MAKVLDLTQSVQLKTSRLKPLLGWMRQNLNTTFDIGACVFGTIAVVALWAAIIGGLVTGQVQPISIR